MKVKFFDLSQHHALRSIKIQILAEINPDWLCAAIASIPEPSGANQRISPLLIELHISEIPNCIGKERHQPLEQYDVEKMKTWWGPVNEQLLRLTRQSLDNYSALGSTATRIKLDFISGADGTCSKGGAARLMFPDANLNYFFY